MIRQEEIKALKEILSENKYSEIKIARSFLEDIIDYFENQNKIGEWIPCSKKLPNSEKEVLITFDFKGKRSVDIGEIHKDGSAYCYSDDYLTPEGRKFRKAVAWMDIPSPYKG